jgi:pimeloyl-ACP methyl ester carboxylesterase
MGGKTAMEFALTFPELISKLIVVDIAPRAYGPAHGEILQALLSVNPKAFQTRREIEAALAPAVPELRVRRFLLKNLARDLAGAFYWKLDLQNIFQNYSSLNAAIAGDRLFEKPARFIRSGRSDYIQEQDFAAIHRLFPRAEICAIRDAGHWVHEEAPDALIENVECFLGKPAPG